MEESSSRRPQGWTVRRATLVDVPAVARLLGAPAPAEWRTGTGLSDQALTSATRLVLTHVALELGQFWVAVEPGERVRAAVVLLPPGRKGGQIIDVALRLELGLLPRSLPEPVSLDVPVPHWLLLPAAGPDDGELLRQLLAAAMPAIDADGRPVLSLLPGPQPGPLVEAGFHALPPAPTFTGSASLRPGARTPVPA